MMSTQEQSSAAEKPLLSPWAVTVRRCLPSFTACWSNAAGYLSQSDGAARAPAGDTMHGVAAADTQALDRAACPQRTTEVWKLDAHDRAAIYADTAGGTVQLVLGTAAARVWAMCDGARTLAAIIRAMGGDTRVAQCVATLVREGLIACRQPNEACCC